MDINYDIVITGAGVFGSWTAYQLQQSGLKVALLDAYGPGHSRASSGGESRIIRMGYGADEIYTRWSRHSLKLWQGFFDRTGQTLFHRTGVLWMARRDDAYTLATVSTLDRVGVEFELLNGSELESRYPQINFGDITWAIYEPGSGALMARRAVQAVVRETVKNGADYFQEGVIAPTGSGRLSEIATLSGRRISGGIFVFACGPWLPNLFPDLLRDRIHPTRQEVFFFGAPAGDSRFASPQMPIWIDFGAEMYGMPDLENRGFKVALDRHGPPFEPDTGERTASVELLNEVRKFLADRFPDLKNAPVVESRVCQYENTSNGDFIIDRHPDFGNVWLVGGGSGHGFKHGPALGEYVAARITNGGEIEKRFTLATKGMVRNRSVF
jgi:monomeric sarcosine oxidase